MNQRETILRLLESADFKASLLIFFLSMSAGGGARSFLNGSPGATEPSYFNANAESTVTNVQ